ncbi:MAG: hypothetical protein ACRDTR_19090, partial [Rubrobacter sp.]
AGESIRAVGADGTTVVCEPDDQGDGGAAQVDALKSELATNDGAPNESSDPVSFSKIKDTPADVMDRDAATLDDRDSTSFADASHQHSGADVTSGTVEADRIEDGADSGLDADAIDGLDSTALQRRVSGTCDPGSAVRAISNDGTVTCEADDTGASEINADDMAPLPAVRARSSNLSVENTTHTPLALTFEDVDQVGAGQTFFSEMHASTTNRFTAPRAGIYEVQAEVIWAGSSAGTTGTGERQIILRKNFTTCGAGSFDGMDVQYADPVEQITNHVSMLMTMNPGDSVILCGYQNSGESLNAVFVFANMHYVSGK